MNNQFAAGTYMEPDMSRKRKKKKKRRVFADDHDTSINRGQERLEAHHDRPNFGTDAEDGPMGMNLGQTSPRGG